MDQIRDTMQALPPFDGGPHLGQRLAYGAPSMGGDPDNELLRRVAEALRASTLSSRALEDRSARVGGVRVSKSTIDRLKRGEQPGISAVKLHSLAKAVGLDVSEVAARVSPAEIQGVLREFLAEERRRPVIRPTLSELKWLMRKRLVWEEIDPSPAMFRALIDGKRRAGD